MRRWSFLITALSFIVIGSTVFAKDAQPQVYEVRDEPHQETHLLLSKPPEQCIGSLLMLNQICWTVYPITSQSFTKKTKRMGLLVSVETTNENLEFSSAALTFAIDGEVIKTNRLYWEPNSNILFRGITTIANENLVRKVANATEVWVTVEVPGPFSVKLSPAVLAGIRTIVQSYDALEPNTPSLIGETRSELEGINTELSVLDAKSVGTQKLVEALNAKCPNLTSSKSCLLSAMELISVAQSSATRTLDLLNKKLAILDHVAHDDATIEERTKTLQVRDEATKALDLLNQYSKIITDDLSTATEP